jgi:hypothetical protein
MYQKRAGDVNKRKAVSGRVLRAQQATIPSDLKPLIFIDSLFSQV